MGDAAEDNAIAAQGMRTGLGSLGDFLYRNSVVKPQIQANTASVQAQTAEQQQQTGQENQTYQSTTVPLQKLQVAAATRQGQMDIKNLYTSTVQRPDVSSDPRFADRVNDADGNPIPDPIIQIPYEEAVQKGFANPNPPTPDDIARGIRVPGLRDAPGGMSSAPLDSTIPFIRQPKVVQDAMVDSVVKNNPSSIPMTRAEAKTALAANDFREATATLPPITPYSLPGGLGITKLSGGPAGVSYEASQPGAQPILGPNGERSGQMMVGGNPVADPNAVPTASVEQHQSEILGLQKSQQRVKQIQDMISSSPDLVGPGIVSGGSTVPRVAREVGAYMGASPNYAKQKQLDMFLTGQLLDTLGQVHIGRVTELEWNQLKNNIPSQSSPKEVWDDYLSRLQDALGKSVEEKKDILRQNGTPFVPGNPYSGQLPPVSPATSVTPPETGRVGDSDNQASTGGAQAGSVTVTTKEQAQAALAAGKTFIYKGVKYGK